MADENRIYLGDGAYAEFDGCDFIVSTDRSNGLHWVALSGEMVETLREFKQRVYGDDGKTE